MRFCRVIGVVEGWVLRLVRWDRPTRARCAATSCRLQQFLEVANHLLDFFGVSAPFAASQIEILLKVGDCRSVVLLLPKEQPAVIVRVNNFRFESDRIV